MTVVQQLTEDMKTALKAKDTVALDSVRFILAKVKNVEIDKPNREPLTETEFHAVVKKLVKDSQEGVSQYQAGNRQDLVDAEQAKIAIYKRYLPAELSSEELDNIVSQVVSENPGLAQGPLMGKIMKATGGRANGNQVAQSLKKHLG